MTEELRRTLSTRLTRFALEVIRLVRGLRRDFVARHIGGQLLRAGTSAAANYRAACRARSRADFISKIGISIEEADESCFWLELLIGNGLVTEQQAAGLLSEGNQLVAMLVASRKTAQANATA
jgi:four helix bundle protein